MGEMMIYDNILKLNSYMNRYENLDKVINYINYHDISKLGLGRHEIDSDKAYVNIVESDLNDVEDGVYELHKRYLDLHMDIIGEENILIGSDTIDKIVEKYNCDDDYELVICPKINEVTINKNNFVICMLNEPHLPCVKTDKCNHVKKAIFKIRIS